MSGSPVSFDLERPTTFSRAHVFLRILLLVVLSWLTGSPTEFGLVYVGLPILAAVLIAQHGESAYLIEDAERVTRWVGMIVSLLAYLALLTDDLPTASRLPIRFAVEPSGDPSVGGALLRIVKAIPSALALMLVGIVSWFVWVVAAVSIILTESYPKRLWSFQRGVVRWEARLLCYLASLVATYPPFSFDTGDE